MKCPGDRQRVADSLNRDLRAINDWRNRWNMKLNSAKTKTMIVSRSRIMEPVHPPLRVDDVHIAESDTLQILDVRFDKLTFEAHVRDMVSRASRSLGVVRKAAHVFQDHSVSLACVPFFVLPLFEHCTSVWGRLVSRTYLLWIAWHVARNPCAEERVLVGLEPLSESWLVEQAV